VFNLQRVADHEAGHVVAAWWFRLPVRGATIGRTILTEGRAFVGKSIEDALLEAAYAKTGGMPIPFRARRLLEHDAMVSIAGPFAELRAIGDGLVPAPDPPPAPYSPEARRLHFEWIDRLDRAREVGEREGESDAEHVWKVVLNLSETADEAEAYGHWLRSGHAHSSRGRSSGSRAARSAERCSRRTGSLGPRAGA